MENKIMRGVMDSYRIFEIFKNSKVDLDREYRKTLKRLIESNLLIINIDKNKGVTFNEYFLGIIKKREVYRDKNPKSLTKNLKGDFIKVPGNQYTFLSSDSCPYITEKEKSIDLLGYSQTKHLSNFLENNNREENYTGFSILDTKNTFMIFPLRLIIDNNVIYVDVRFTIFKHGYGILNTSIDINNCSVEKLELDSWNIDIDSAYLPNFVFQYVDNHNKFKKTTVDKNTNNFKYKKIGGCKTLNEAIDRYINILQDFLLGEQTYSTKFETLAIQDMSEIPESFEDDNTLEYRESIYKLLNAPVVSKPHSKNINDFLNDNSFTLLSNAKTYVNQYRLIHVYSKKIYDEFKNKSNCQELDTEYININLYESFKGDFLFAIEKLLLRKHTNWKYFERLHQKKLTLRRLYKINMNRELELRYENDHIFYRYTTTRNIINFLYEKCIDPYIENILNDNRKRLIELNRLERNISNSEFTFLVSFLTVIFSILFAIPSIESTLEFFQIIDQSTVLNLYIIFIIFIMSVFILVFRHKLINGVNNLYLYLKYIYITIKIKIKDK